MLGLIFVIIAFTIVLAFLEDYLGKPKKYLYWAVCAMLVLYAALRPIGFDRDSMVYEFSFHHYDNPILMLMYEPTFTYFSEKLRNVVPDIHIIFLLYALLSIPLKFYTFKRFIPEFLFLPVLIYLGNFYVLHDLTQIRASVAGALFLFAVFRLSEGNRKQAFFIILTGTLFHYSSLILLPALFLNNNTLTRQWKIALYAVVPIAILLGILNINLLAEIPIPGIKEKLDSYQNMGAKFYDRSPMLTPFTYLKFGAYITCIYFSETIEKHIKGINLIIRVMACSILLYYFFSSITIFSQRFSELYGVVEIILYSSLVYIGKPRWVGKIIITVMAIYQVYYSYIYWTLLDFRGFGNF